jgi:hypothetical protein
MSSYPIELYATVPSQKLDFTVEQKIKKGRSETYFDYKLDKYFRGFIKKNVSLSGASDRRRYKPDYIFYDDKRNIFIDIEVDEPYVFFRNIPVHYQGKDEKRNAYFLSKGWDVIRFTEEQVINQPIACCKFISQHIYNRCGEHIWLDGFSMVEDLKESDHLSEEQAAYLATTGFRFGYGKSLKLNLVKRYTFIIVVDTIFLNQYFNKTFSFYKTADHVESKLLEKASLSLFIGELIRSSHYFNPEENKLKVEILFFISNYHSFRQFDMAEDVLVEGIQVDTFYIRTDNILCFEIGDYISDKQKRNILLIADDPAYPGFVESWAANGCNILLGRKDHDSFMPGHFNYVNLSRAAGLAIGLQSYEI